MNVVDEIQEGIALPRSGPSATANCGGYAGPYQILTSS